MSRSSVLTSTELFINMKDVPRYDPTKSYFEQSKEVLDFWDLEVRKLREGVNIGGYFFHPWIYWHLNFFKTPIPVFDPSSGKSKDKVMVPELDDLFLYIAESYQEAEEKDKGLFLFGTRGATKSTIISSLNSWTVSTKPNTSSMIIGGSSPDLDTISMMLKVALEKVHPALYTPRNRSDWDREVEFGMKSKDNRPLIQSRLSIINADPNKKSSTEKGAGNNPAGFTIDEALCENTLIPTPDGHKTMKEIQVDDYVMSEDNLPTKVISKIDPGIQPTYSFSLSNGEKPISSLNHKWKVYVKKSKNYQVFTTDKILTLGIHNFKIPSLDGLLDIQETAFEGFRQVYCIGVEDKRKTFLIGGGVVTHNCGKFNFLEIYESALPSFKTPYGFRLVPTLSGTGGNTKLSQDARKVLTNPDSYDMLLCNWERLERHVPEEEITWEQSKKSKFGVFIPGQMTRRLVLPKIKKDLGEITGLRTPELKNIPIHMTDWRAANKMLTEIIDNEKDEDKRNKNKMYYPRETADCFLTRGTNPFPVKVIDRHVRMLEEKGSQGKKVELYRQGSKQMYDLVDKPLPEISHIGGSIDSPVIIYEEPPEEPPTKYSYVSGLDGYKLNVSETSSLGSLYVLKRRHLELNSPCETIAACYNARPDKMRIFHQNCEKTVEAWNAECCIEAIDIGFQQYLEAKGKDYKLLAPSYTLSQNKGANTKLKSSYGIFPTIQNKEFMFNLLIDYCKEEHTIGFDDDGHPIIKLGVEFIEDIPLLKEMLAYYKGGNFDRITAFMHALTHARELDKREIHPIKDNSKFSKERSKSKSNLQGKYGNLAIRQRLKKL